MELADTADSKSAARKGVRVQVPPFLPSCGSLAQLAEQRTFNPRVLGSIPRRPTIFKPGAMVKRISQRSSKPSFQVQVLVALPVCWRRVVNESI